MEQANRRIVRQEKKRRGPHVSLEENDDKNVERKGEKEIRSWHAPLEALRPVAK